MTFSKYSESIEDNLHNFALEFENKAIECIKFNYNINLEVKDLSEFLSEIIHLNEIIKDKDIEYFIQFGNSLLALFYNL